MPCDNTFPAESYQKELFLLLLITNKSINAPLCETTFIYLCMLLASLPHLVASTEVFEFIFRKSASDFPNLITTEENYRRKQKGGKKLA